MESCLHVKNCFVLLATTFLLLSNFHLNHIAEATNGSIRAILAFGDSFLDTGNNNNLNTKGKANYPLYGKDFPGGIATGRWSNGRVFSDLIADGLGVKSILPAYLDPNLQDSDLPTGVSFASGGSGLDPSTARQQGILSITDQLNLFKDYIAKLNRILGKGKANDTISKTLFLISSGSNDFFYNQYNISTYPSQLVTWASDFVKDLYNLGARRIGFAGAVALGCLPSLRTDLHKTCAGTWNQVAQLYNSKLSFELNSLNNTLKDVKIFYLDVYKLMLDLIQNYKASGFEVSTIPCCGIGENKLKLRVCKQWNPFVCNNVSEYVFWDTRHLTQRAYGIIVSQALHKYANNFS